VGAIAVAWAIAVRAPSVTVAAAASTPPHVQVVRLAACPFPRNLRAAFEAAAADAQVPPALLYAVAKVESNMSQDATSSAGARGLLQVMPATARSLDLDPDQASSNVLAGARYLRQLLDRFNSTDLALAAYNAGPTAVERAGGAPSGVTIAYVENVTSLWRAFNGCT